MRVAGRLASGANDPGRTRPGHAARAHSLHSESALTLLTDPLLVRRDHETNILSELTQLFLRRYLPARAAPLREHLARKVRAARPLPRVPMRGPYPYTLTDYRFCYVRARRLWISMPMEQRAPAGAAAAAEAAAARARAPARSRCKRAARSFARARTGWYILSARGMRESGSRAMRARAEREALCRVGPPWTCMCVLIN